MRLELLQPKIADALESLIEPVTRGDTMLSLRWTCKSTRTLAEALSSLGFAVRQHQSRHVAQSTRIQPAGKQKNNRRETAS